MAEEYYKTGFIGDNGKDLKHELVYNLHKKPTKPKRDEMTRFQPAPKDMYHQADLLHMPNDNGYKYALVVVDQGTRLCDVVPLESKTAEDVKHGFEVIYDRNVLKMPKIITVDSGSEFKGVVSTYFKDHKVGIHTALPNRHNTVGIV